GRPLDVSLFFFSSRRRHTRLQGDWSSDVCSSDLFFLAFENLGLIREDGVHGAPDLVVEIISPSNAQLDLRRKRPLYAKHGVKERSEERRVGKECRCRRRQGHEEKKMGE